MDKAGVVVNVPTGNRIIIESKPQLARANYS